MKNVSILPKPVITMVNTIMFLGAQVLLLLLLFICLFIFVCLFVFRLLHFVVFLRVLPGKSLKKLVCINLVDNFSPSPQQLNIAVNMTTSLENSVDEMLSSVIQKVCDYVNYVT